MESGKIKNEALLEAIEVFKAENNQQNLKNFIEKLLQARLRQLRDDLHSQSYPIRMWMI